jgi:hypothetical protein
MMRRPSNDTYGQQDYNLGNRIVNHAISPNENKISPPPAKCCCSLDFADLLGTYLRRRSVHFQVGLQAFQEEAVCHTAPVNVLSRDHS